MKIETIENFLSKEEIDNLTYDNVEEFKSNTGNLKLYYQKEQQSIQNKIEAVIGPCKVRNKKSIQVYELKQPYRLHCDSGWENEYYYTIIVPLDKQPQGGLYIMEQWADEACSLDSYYSQNVQAVLTEEQRKKKIMKYDDHMKLPDTIDFAHIKNKTGFVISKFVEYEYNKAVMFPCQYFHCSQNVEPFTQKRALTIFTNQLTTSELLMRGFEEEQKQRELEE